MDTELLFGIAIAVLMLLLAFVRFSQIGWATFGLTTSDKRITTARASKTWYVLYIVIGWLCVLAPLVYVLAPGWLQWATLPISTMVRWIGVGLGLTAIVLLSWVHRTLGKNWNAPGVIQERQTLVTVGPYRWVRHPMYSSLAMIALAYALISANGLIALTGLAFGILVFSRVGTEEASLIDKFGDSYREYMRHSGRFFPRIGA